MFGLNISPRDLFTKFQVAECVCWGIPQRCNNSRKLNCFASELRSALAHADYFSEDDFKSVTFARHSGRMPSTSSSPRVTFKITMPVCCLLELVVHTYTTFADNLKKKQQNP